MAELVSGQGVPEPVLSTLHSCHELRKEMKPRRALLKGTAQSTGPASGGRHRNQPRKGLGKERRPSPLSQEAGAVSMRPGLPLLPSSCES